MISKKKIALIFGITGQDGSYLSELLLSKGYKVIGIKRRTSLISTDRIDHLLDNPNFNKIAPSIRVIVFVPNDLLLSKSNGIRLNKSEKKIKTTTEINNKIKPSPITAPGNA